MPEGGHAGGDEVSASGWRRWLALGFTLSTVTLVVIDSTVLIVSVARIIEDLDTDVVGVQWCFTGYAVVFASGLVIAGRLGDMYGPRRMVLLGTTLFGVGSLIAALSQSLPMLLLGQSLIEGIGAALLVPNTLSLIARTFSGRSRIAAFSAYATSLGAAASVGPVLGGYLTSEHSWRWAFGINVILAPVVFVGLLVTTSRDPAAGGRQRLDVRGALLIAGGMFLLVFGLSQGGVYGWWAPTAPVTIGDLEVWGASAPISVVPIALLCGVALLVAFCRTEIGLERRAAHPLFEFSQFRLRTFRLANLSTFFSAFGQLGVAVSLALYLQDVKGLSPLQNGLWVAPANVALLFGAPFGGWMSRRTDATTTLRVGVVGQIVGLGYLVVTVPMDVPYANVLPGFLVYGFATGLYSSQLTRVMLNDIAPSRSGAASGMNQTARQVATALGVATMGMVFAVVSAAYGLDSALRPPLTVAMGTLAISALFVWRLPRIDARPPEVSEAPGAPELSPPGRAGVVPGPIG
jgi:EmrB/QacA subfamily drug resistance transporter